MNEAWPAPADVPGATSGGSLPGASRFRKNRVVWLLTAVVVALGAVAGWGLYAMHTNEVRASSWQRRAGVLQRDESQLQSLLSSRSRLLNQRIDQVNSLASKLRGSQVALGQSQGDVSSLEVRQRELANEKAQLQDQQAALDGVASNYVSCKQDLIQLLSDVTNGYDTTYDYNVANSDCSSADSSLQSYLNNWPNG